MSRDIVTNHDIAVQSGALYEAGHKAVQGAEQVLQVSPISKFGTLADGRTAHLLTLHYGSTTVKITDYGARLVSFIVPDNHGVPTDIVLGCAALADYESDTCCLGAVIGRNANRIEGAQFTLGNQTYYLSHNDGDNNNHSGPDGYEHRLWSIHSCSDTTAVLSLDSPDGDQGFPGALHVQITYTLDSQGLSIAFQALADADTLVNLTNHSYFNLDGASSRSILNTKLQIHASNFYPIKDEGAIPTGMVLPVADTPMDFRSPITVAELRDDAYEQIRLGHGYNHSYVLDKDAHAFGPVATAVGEHSGIRLAVSSDLPVVHFYSADFLGGTRARDGHIYQPREGFALECQYAPNAINMPGALKPIVKAHEMVYSNIRFDIS